MIKNKNEWQKAFEKQMDIAEKPNIAKVKRYYKKEYNKGIKSFLSLNGTSSWAKRPTIDGIFEI